MKNEEIGKRIKQRRKALNISVMDIATYTGLSKATIHRYENGDIKDIKLPVVETIAFILNVNPIWLIGKSDRQMRADSRTNDICVALDQMIMYVSDNTLLMCDTRLVTDAERRMIINTLQLAKDIMNKGDK